MYPVSLVVETIERAPFKLYILIDEDPPNPRENDNLAVLVADYRRYNLGDRKPTDEEYTALRKGGWDGLRTHLTCQYGPILALEPLALLDHGVQHLYIGSQAHWSDSGGWDSGLIGFAYVTAARAAELGALIEHRNEWIKGDVDEYDKYLRGEAFGYSVTRTRTMRATDGSGFEQSAEEVLDDCWGFLGYDYVMDEAMSSLNYYDATERGLTQVPV